MGPLQYVSSYLMLIVSASALAITDKDWFEAQMTSAVDTAAPWKIDRPEVVITDSQHIEVTGDGRIFIGSPLINRLRELENGEQLTRFLLLHEIRHVMQRRQRREASSPELECDSDYFAILLMARESLSRSTPAARNKDLTNALALQHLAASAGALALTSRTEGHLTARERFAAGAFATWRALHEYLTSPDLVTLKPYAEVRNRAKGFVAPADLDVDAWAADFCAAATRPSQTLSFLRISISQSTFIADPPDGVMYFREETEFENQSDRAIRLRAWPVMGLRSTKQPNNFELAAAISADYIDVTIPAKSKAKANHRTYYPGKEPKDMELFTWTSSGEWFIASAQSLGERIEPSNCARSWTPPVTPQITTLFQFMLRSGAVAGRKFEGVLGPPKYPNLPASELKFYSWESPPEGVSAEKSYIVLSRGQTSGILVLLETTDLVKAKAKFIEHMQAFRQACAASGQTLQERSNDDGGSSLIVDHLTLSSEATLYLSVERDRKQPASSPTYSVFWSIRPKE